MLNTAEKLQAAFEKLVHKDVGYGELFKEIGLPTPIDWENVITFVSFLKIFHDVAKVFSSSQQVSIYTAFHNLASILCELQKASMDLNTIVDGMRVEMKAKYDKYWDNVVK